MTMLCNTTGWQSIFRFHPFSGMNFRVQFQICRVGASLFSGGAVYVYVLMVLYSELAVCSYWITVLIWLSLHYINRQYIDHG